MIKIVSTPDFLRCLAGIGFKIFMISNLFINILLNLSF